MRVSKQKFFVGMFFEWSIDNLQDTEEQMDKFYVTRFLLALRLEQCGLQRLNFPKYLQPSVPYPHRTAIFVP